MLALTTTLLGAAAQDTGGLSGAEAALYGAGIAALASVLTTLMNWGVQSKLAGRTEEAVDTKERVARITNQLSDLYGPLRLLIEQSSALAQKLREQKTNPESWHLLENLTEVAREPTDRAIADQIITVNGQIESRIFDHAGLLDRGEIPSSFVEFLGHYRFLQIAFEAAKHAIDDGASAADEMDTPRGITAREFQYYPRQFDEDVAAAYERLQNERRALVAS